MAKAKRKTKDFEPVLTNPNNPKGKSLYEDRFREGGHRRWRSESETDRLAADFPDRSDAQRAKARAKKKKEEYERTRAKGKRVALPKFRPPGKAGGKRVKVTKASAKQRIAQRRAAKRRAEARK